SQLICISPVQRCCVSSQYGSDHKSKTANTLTTSDIPVLNFDLLCKLTTFGDTGHIAAWL
ncbi:MAG: hypothetical protein ACOYEV_19625, partial [Candidatus Nanopelagicales bacterium]